MTLPHLISKINPVKMFSLKPRFKTTPKLGPLHYKDHHFKVPFHWFYLYLYSIVRPPHYKDHFPPDQVVVSITEFYYIYMTKHAYIVPFNSPNIYIWNFPSVWWCIHGLYEPSIHGTLMELLKCLTYYIYNLQSIWQHVITSCSSNRMSMCQQTQYIYLVLCSLCRVIIRYSFGLLGNTRSCTST